MGKEAARDFAAKQQPLLLHPLHFTLVNGKKKKLFHRKDILGLNDA